MKRKTAYKLAIEALEEKRRRQYAFDYHLHERFSKGGVQNKPTLSAHKRYIRIGKAIEILETERDQIHLDLSKVKDS
jgi:hypothetical protein